MDPVDFAHPAALATRCDPPRIDARGRMAGFWSPPHVQYASKRLRDGIVEGDSHFLISEPPRHGKSTLCALWLIIWFLSIWPYKRAVYVTHTASLARLWGRRIRDRIARHQDVIPFRVSKTKDAADEFDVDGHDEGGFLSLGVGGPFTGRGGDLVVVDDIIKNPEQANSETYRENHWEYWTDTIVNRMEPGGSQVVMHTRWHEDDLTGRLKKSEEAAEWECIDFPAIALEDDVLGRKPGEALWPERFDEKALDKIRRRSGPYAWSALYQQRPAPPGGAVFARESFRYFYPVGEAFVLLGADGEVKYTVRQDECRSFQIVDTAMTEKTYSDFTVIATLAVTPRDDVLVMDIQRKQIAVPDQWNFIMASRNAWVRASPRYQFLAIENRGSGIGLLQLADRLGVRIRALDPTTDKVTRASDAATMYSRNKVFHLRDAPWLADFEDELCSFPLGAHDDQVDAIAYGVLSIPARLILPPSRIEPVRVLPEDDGSGYYGRDPYSSPDDGDRLLDLPVDPY